MLIAGWAITRGTVLPFAPVSVASAARAAKQGISQSLQNPTVANNRARPTHAGTAPNLSVAANIVAATGCFGTAATGAATVGLGATAICLGTSVARTATVCFDHATAGAAIVVHLAAQAVPAATHAATTDVSYACQGKK